MRVRGTVVPGALLLDPGAPGPDAPDLRAYDDLRFRRRRRLSAGAVLGLHLVPRGGLLLDVVAGAGYAVVVDARPAAETFGRLAVQVLDAGEGHRLIVPPGCLVGVQALEERTVVETATAVRRSRPGRAQVDPDDPDLRIRWLLPRTGHGTTPPLPPDAARSWTALCGRLGVPAGPRRDRVSHW
ncbi:dTDP-4-dehydrorhamnose 3,5-epimerase family protein [Pseudonocardia phyllosphaerae]|uniref:dTDP-4-dehydrorhamnose 3,5-epimerase family protein n=1 Tax=Pseudonocardia phyllosphaerae TaxID=3390502 RepID=UPI003978AD30